MSRCRRLWSERGVLAQNLLEDIVEQSGVSYTVGFNRYEYPDLFQVQSLCPICS